MRQNIEVHSPMLTIEKSSRFSNESPHCRRRHNNMYTVIFYKINVFLWVSKLLRVLCSTILQLYFKLLVS